MTKHLCLLSMLAALGGLAAATACTTTTTVTAQGTPDAGESSTDDASPGEVPDNDASADAPGDGHIGTRSDLGKKSVDVDLSSHGSYACDTVCTAAGGSCKEGGGNGVGWVARKYNDGSGSTSNQISSCDLTEGYFSGNTTMTGMTCFCSDMKVPPTVRVRKSEGLFTCDKVCSSWSLTCSTTRKNYSFLGEEETGSTAFDCNTVPDAASHHYTCSCDL
jgi:hypothetical protein